MWQEHFEAIEPTQVSGNAFQLIGHDWMLVTAGVPGAVNMMTASWGGMGVMWNRPVCLAVVRPQRYTFEFLERESVYSLCFFDEQLRSTLTFCGTESGRDVDKVKETGLTPIEGPGGAIIWQQARLAFCCRKIHVQDIDPAGFVDPTLAENYPIQDYHRTYVGEVLQVLQRKDLGR